MTYYTVYTLFWNLIRTGYFFYYVLICKMLERCTFFHVTVHVYRKGNVYNFRTL